MFSDRSPKRLRHGLAFRRLGRFIALACAVLATSAHVGSPDTWFAGTAGPYGVQVVIRLPGVVPGLAQIDISVSGDGVQEVTAQPVIFDAGPGGAPPPDVAVPVAGRPGGYHAQLWFMRPGSFSVTIAVRGALGAGTVIVPVAAVPERQIGLYPWLGWLLAALGAILFVGAVTIFRAAGMDGITPPGLAPTARQRRSGLQFAVIGAGIVGVSLYGAHGWWNAVERDYTAELYHPYAASANVDTLGGVRSLRFVITDSAWITRRARSRLERFSVSPLVPDHGKLMHLFLVGQGEQRAFAHLHPTGTDSSTFVSSLGSLPSGRYRAFADVVHETGFPQTMVADVDVPAAGRAEGVSDADDAFFDGTPTGATYTFPDRSTITWEGKRDTLVADQDAGMRFTVRNADGSEAALTPYLGMPAHAVVARTDGEVFIHLHPNGTISMVAQQALGAHRQTDTVPGMLARRLAEDAPAMAHAPTSFGGTFAFPYAFPKAGAYRVWVQFRRDQGIVTAPFDVAVR